MTLLTDPDDIAAEASKQYKALLTKRRHCFDTMSDDWKEVYKPSSTIDPTWFDHLMDKPSHVEWMSAVRSTSSTSAPGISGIGYRVIKRASKNTHDVLRTLAHICYSHSTIPDQWKLSQLYPIPKPTDWKYNLGQTRPIILLECIRKLCVKIITQRLSKICSDHNILAGPNFMGLKGESTKIPIHTLQNLTEDAHQKKREMWIALQDMAKAFDSIGMLPLRKSLERIRLPTQATDWIINLFQRRSTQVITAFGLSQPLIAQDGINQGEVILPLLWRIFYDPLLSRIQSDPRLGYTMSSSWRTSIYSDKIVTMELRCACLAYADDTIWIGKNKQDLERIIEISNEFFDLNDIAINGKKSELIIINPSVPTSDQHVRMGRDNAIVKNNGHSPTRYLGIWLTNNPSNIHTVSIVRSEIMKFV